MEIFQASPGLLINSGNARSQVFSASLYLGLGVAQIQPKMIPLELTFGPHCADISNLLTDITSLCFCLFFQMRQKVHQKSGCNQKGRGQELLLEQYPALCRFIPDVQSVPCTQAIPLPNCA
ncbi:MAG: hypothetical protein CSA33_02690 [Desulfobulbus propionicus]|nr:MAG: hypothetical protein CSA33_02690 [Desulfobulbus propionicus]